MADPYMVDWAGVVTMLYATMIDPLANAVETLRASLATEVTRHIDSRTVVGAKVRIQIYTR
jgi:hypothetical protein